MEFAPFENPVVIDKLSVSVHTWSDSFSLPTGMWFQLC